MDNTTQLDRLTELAIVHRAQLRELAEQFPVVRDELRAEIERRIELCEPRILGEAERVASAKTEEEVVKAADVMRDRLDQMFSAVRNDISARAEELTKARNELAQIVKHSSSQVTEELARLPGAVSQLVSAQGDVLRAETQEQLKTFFAEPRLLNPRGEWKRGNTYQKLDVVGHLGSSYVANETSKGVPPSAKSKEWTLLARRGAGGSIAEGAPGSGSVTSVAASVPTGLTISGSPVTTTGTLAIGLDTGYAIPLQTTLDKADTAVQPGDLAAVAFSGDYDDLSNKPTIPTGTVTSIDVSGGTTGLTTSGGPVTSSGTITLAGTLAVTNGGTGATDASTALSNLGAYPASNPSGFTSNTGTVTSVAASVPTGLTISGSPVTTSGTLAIALDTGYVIPTQTTLDGKQAASAVLTAYAGGDTPSAFTLGIVDAVDAAAWRSAIGAGTSSFSGVFADLTSKPTTLSGYGITDGQPLDAALTALAGGSDFVQFTGPASSTKVFTLPNASATILTTNALVTGEQGGTGVNNSGKTITLGGNLTTSGANALTFTTGGATNVTLPTTGTLATLAGSESLTNKKLGSLTSNGLVTTSAGDGTLGVTVPGTGVLTALGTNVGSAGAFVTFNGALGTPSSGTVTNLTGTASININGTIGATTPSTGAFTSVSISGNLTQSTAVDFTPQHRLTHIGSTAGSAPFLIFERARASTANVASGDALFYINSAGYFDGAYRDAARITASVSGTPSGTNVPAQLNFSVNGGSGLATRAVLAPSGAWVWSAYGAGILRTDASGNVTASAAIDGTTIGATTPSTGSFTNVSLGATPGTGSKLRLGGNWTGGVNVIAASLDGTVLSDVTSSLRGWRTAIGTQAASFTVSFIDHFTAQQGAFGAGSTVTLQRGFVVDSGFTGATTNRAFVTEITEGSGRHGLYFSGTVQNWLAGRLGIGTGKATPAYDLDVAGQAQFGGGIVPRIASITSNATWAPNAATTDQYNVTAQAVAVTTISNPSGTPADGQKLIIRAKCDGTNRALTWSGSQWRAVGVAALPTTLLANKLTVISAMWNAAESTWDVLAVAEQP
jgi:hypothetical protein